MIRNNLILILCFLIISCNHNETKEESLSLKDKKKYSFLEASKDKENTLQSRMKAVNKAFRLKNNEVLDSLLLAIIYQKSYLHYKLNEADSNFFYNKLLRRKSLKNHNTYYSGKAHLNLALNYKSRGIYDSAFFHFNLSKNTFLKKNDSSQIGRRLMSMGLIQNKQSDFFGSKETLTEALQYLKPPKDSKYIASSYSALATSHRKLLNYEDAINFYNTAINTTLSTQDKFLYKNNLAATFIDNKEYKKAIAILEKISKDYLTINSNQDYARVIDNLTYAKWLSGVVNKNTDFSKALGIRKKIKDHRGQIASYTHLGEFYSKSNTQKATAYFDSVIQLAKKLKMPTAEKDALRFLMKIDSENVFIRDRYVVLNDSLYAQELKVKTQFAKYKYDDKLKQESILRLKKEKAEREVELAKQRTRKVMSYGGIALLLLGICFLVYYYVQRTKSLKQKNRTAKLTATFETEAQLARRVHDDFGAKLNHSMSLVQNDTEKMVVLDLLESIYNQSRDFSREINEVDTGDNYKSELFQMLQGYTAKIKLYTVGTKGIDWISVNALGKTVLYKVLRELMINMDKHSNATAVTITFSTTPQILKINYSDNGVGASGKELNLKNGLRITEKRIKAINGTIIFESEKGKGFKAEIQIPN